MMCAEAEQYWAALEDELNDKLAPQLSPKLQKEINDILEDK